jgi:hypothetical protein
MFLTLYAVVAQIILFMAYVFIPNMPIWVALLPALVLGFAWMTFFVFVTALAVF